MSIFDIFNFKRSATYSDTDDGNDSELSKNVALRYGAINKVANYVGRGVSKAKFVLKGPNADQYSEWLYRLNVQPNPNQTAAVFLAEIGKALINNGEALVVVRNKFLYLAESYSIEEKSLDGHTYKVSTVQGLTFDESFTSDEVILITNENNSLKNFSEQLWADYGELLGRVISRQKTANQLRFTFKLPKNRLKEKAQDMIEGAPKEDAGKNFFEKVTKKIKNDSVVGIPLTDHNDPYSEYTTKNGSKVSYVSDIKDLKDQYVDDLCEAIGLPAMLLHGDVADNQKNYEMAVETVFEPLLQKVIDGLQTAIFSDAEYLAGNRVKAVGLHQYNLFDVATSGDKLIAAGLAMADEIREEIGLEPLPDGLGQRLYITKNYLEMRKEGGTVDENNSNQGDDSSQQQ